MEAKIEFIVDTEAMTTSLVVDDVEMSKWINRQPPTWAKKLIEIIEQRNMLQD